MSTDKLYIETPLRESHELSKLSGFQIFLKLENVQPVSSFKIRGISCRIQKAVKNGCKRLVVPSSGNGGLAAAYCAHLLQVPITVYVPEVTAPAVVARLEEEGARVVPHGKDYFDAYGKALEECKTAECMLVHPYDQPDVWEGNSSIVEEIERQLGRKPDAIVCSVGGGGLMNGLVIGTRRVGWSDVPLVALETEGADCFNQALKEDKLVTLPAITSCVQSLGARTVSEQLFKYAKERKILSEVVTDKEAIEACVRFADDERMLVEPSCGAALSAVYSGILSRLQKEGKIGNLKTVVIVVCGGHSVTLAKIDSWKQQFGLK